MLNFELNWKAFDGPDIFAQGWEPVKKPFKAVVCLVHGIGEHTARYENTARALTEKNLVLFGSDMRGHGRSAEIRGFVPSAGVILQDIDTLLEHARKRYPNLPLILYGHSLGGILVLYYGLKRNPDVKGVIATSPGLHNAVEKEPVKVMAAKILGSLFPKVTLASGLDTSAITRDRQVVEAYINDPFVHDRIALGFGKIMIGVNRWTLDHASEFALPLLLMHGSADSIAFPSGSLAFAEKLKGKCKLVMWEGAFHELHHEPEKADVFRTMTDWIDEQIAK